MQNKCNANYGWEIFKQITDVPRGTIICASFPCSTCTSINQKKKIFIWKINEQDWASTYKKKETKCPIEHDFLTY